MGYQALLFCPDEKTARTVTQVLSELEFNVESCTEPFAAVKKLMGQHFDAVVVDCDNEQNATLLFKSARNSTSNQASLAVAVVEGQAGVAKAFRIGANLVLTKPINIEQAKGTLRVARGLLRKSEPGKPAAPVPAASAAMLATPKPAAPAKPEIPATEAVSTIPVPARNVTTSAWPAAASANNSVQDEDLLDIGGDALPESAPVKKFITPSLQADKFLAGAVMPSAPEAKAPVSPAAPTLSGGAASAPAPARERQDTRVADASLGRTDEAEARSTKAEAVPTESFDAAAPVPTFTFGGANAPAESSGAGKKAFLGLAAAAIIAIAAYAGWAHFHGRTSASDSTETETISATTQESVKPSAKPSPAAAGTLKPSSPSLQSIAPTAKGHTGDENNSAADETRPSGSAKPSNSSSSDTSTTDDATDNAQAPLVVKSGKAPAVHTKLGAADAPAPSMVGIAAAGATAPPPDLGSSPDITPKPMLQTLNISQGVSRGLLYKKVQPVYPRTALDMRVEGAVELMATISKTGDITRVKVLSGDSQLSKAAVDAVKQWKYKPYLLNGEPVEIQTQVTINFKLPK